jgi:hypothetical protein
MTSEGLRMAKKCRNRSGYVSRADVDNAKQSERRELFKRSQLQAAYLEKIRKLTEEKKQS